MSRPYCEIALHRQSLAGSAALVRSLEQCVPGIFADWVKADTKGGLLEAVSDDPDMEYAMVDATIVKVHRHGQGAKGGLKAAGHRPFEGRDDHQKPDLDPDALGNLVRFVLLPGQRFDTVGVPPLIEGLTFYALIADKAFDSNAIIANSTRGAPRSSSPSIRAAQSLSPSTTRCTNGGI